MGLFNKLVFDKERKDIIGELKNTAEPLILWGAGNVAELAVTFLRRNDIGIDGVFEWPKKYNLVFHDIDVHTLEEIEQSYPEYNVLLGHSHYSKAGELKKYAVHMKKIFYLFNADYDCRCFDKAIIRDNIAKYEMAYDCLADNVSRVNFEAFINTKITGDIQYIFDVFNGEKSFFANDIYEVGAKECFWNIGAACGETVREFLDIVNGNFKQVVCLEPDPGCYGQLVNYTAKWKQGILTYPIAAWSKQEEVSFSQNNNEATQLGMIQTGEEKDGIIVTGLPLDDLLQQEQDVLPPTIISANYSYGIVEMLEGGSKILQAAQPRLAITVGHNDEYGIPRVVEAIKRINPKYKVYLRYNQAFATMLVIYAVVAG